MVRPRANPQNRTTTTRKGQPLKQSRDPESKQPSLEKIWKRPKIRGIIYESAKNRNQTNLSTVRVLYNLNLLKCREYTNKIGKVNGNYMR